jgi:DNA-binding transcriptional ArsR family regulator
VCDISSVVWISQTAVSHPLRVLRNMALVKYQKDGKIA